MDKTFLNSLSLNFFYINSGTIIFNFNNNLVTFVRCFKQYSSSFVFSCLCTNIWHFNTVVNRVTNTVHNWIQKIFNNRFIKFCVFTFNYKVNFFIQITLQVSNNTRETTENLIDRNHSDFHYTFLKFTGNCTKLLCIRTEFCCNSFCI